MADEGAGQRALEGEVSLAHTWMSPELMEPSVSEAVGANLRSGTGVCTQNEEAARREKRKERLSEGEGEGDPFAQETSTTCPKRLKHEADTELVRLKALCSKVSGLMEEAYKFDYEKLTAATREGEPLTQAVCCLLRHINLHSPTPHEGTSKNSQGNELIFLAALRVAFHPRRVFDYTEHEGVVEKLLSLASRSMLECLKFLLEDPMESLPTESLLSFCLSWGTYLSAYEQWSSNKAVRTQQTKWKLTAQMKLYQEQQEVQRHLGVASHEMPHIVDFNLYSLRSELAVLAGENAVSKFEEESKNWLAAAARIVGELLHLYQQESQAGRDVRIVALRNDLRRINEESLRELDMERGAGSVSEDGDRDARARARGPVRRKKTTKPLLAKMAQHLNCLICQQLLLRPHTVCPGQHKFCQDCLHKQRDLMSPWNCATCRAPITAPPVLDRVLHGLTDEMAGDLDEDQKNERYQRERALKNGEYNLMLAPANSVPVMELDVDHGPMVGDGNRWPAQAHNPGVDLAAIDAALNSILGLLSDDRGSVFALLDPALSDLTYLEY